MTRIPKSIEKSEADRSAFLLSLMSTALPGFGWFSKCVDEYYPGLKDRKIEDLAGVAENHAEEIDALKNHFSLITTEKQRNAFIAIVLKIATETSPDYRVFDCFVKTLSMMSDLQFDILDAVRGKEGILSGQEFGERSIIKGEHIFLAEVVRSSEDICFFEYQKLNSLGFLDCFTESFSDDKRVHFDSLSLSPHGEIFLNWITKDAADN